MYNVKILKYPSGWQIRTYERPVGFCDNGVDSVEKEMDTAFVWDDDAQDYISERYNPRKKAVEPFTGQLATFITEEKEKDSERSLKCSMNRTINKVYHLSRSNTWDWFVTLTFDPVKVDSFDYDECVKKLKIWLDNIRRTSPDIRYIIVPEKHKSGRFHFHGLLAECVGLDFAESGHYTDNGQPIYNIGRYRLGWSTATKVMDNERVTKYISKYITKELCAVASGRKRYWASRNLDECEVEEYIVEGADMTEYIERLKTNCKWCKSVKSAELTTTYFEMGVIDEYNS